MNKLLITIVLAMCLVAYASIDDPYSDGDTSVDTRPINVKHHWVHDSKLSNHHELHRHIHRRIDDPYSGDSVDDPYSGDGDTSVDVSNKPSINPDDVEYHWVHDNKYSNRRKSIRNRHKNRGAIFKCFKESSECGGKYELMKVKNILKCCLNKRRTADDKYSVEIRVNGDYKCYKCMTIQPHSFNY